jgi:hypothetical protein
MKSINDKEANELPEDDVLAEINSWVDSINSCKSDILVKLEQLSTEMEREKD